MICLRLVVFTCACALLVSALPAPDSAGHVPLPGPGLSYGGIPYGSVSGNVAPHFNRPAAPSGRNVNFGRGSYGNSLEYSQIDQYL